MKAAMFGMMDDIVKDAREEARKEELAVLHFLAGLAGLEHHIPVQVKNDLFFNVDPYPNKAFAADMKALGHKHDAEMVELARKHFGANNVRSGEELMGFQPRIGKLLQRLVGAEATTKEAAPANPEFRKMFEDMLNSPDLPEDQRAEMQRDFDARFPPEAEDETIAETTATAAT